MQFREIDRLLPRPRRKLYKWQVTDYVTGESLGGFPNQNEMLAGMRVVLGLGGKFRCTDGVASYAYEITKWGYDRIEGVTPVERQRAGRKTRRKFPW